MRKIAIFIPTLYGGGAERVMVTLANAFFSRGYAVDLLLADAKGPYLKDVANGVRIIDLAAGRVLKTLFPLVRYLRSERPNAMLSAMTHANIMAILARIFSRIPMTLIVSERNTISMEAKNAHGLIARVIYAMVPLLYKYTDGIITVSNAASKDLCNFAKLSPTDVCTIYNPFDISNIKSRAREELHHSWFRSGQPPVILAIGRLCKQKNFFSLISAFSKLRNKGLVARLIILGDGDMRMNLQEYAFQAGLTAQDIDMPGFVKNPFPYLSQSSLYVQSSLWEGLPGALIEALICGTPVVSTDCLSGPSEILEGGIWGTLVPVGNTDALAEAIYKALCMPRTDLADVRKRGNDFGEVKAVDDYLAILFREIAV